VPLHIKAVVAGYQARATVEVFHRYQQCILTTPALSRRQHPEG
jgi:hypothetical protein